MKRTFTVKDVGFLQLLEQDIISLDTPITDENGGASGNTIMDTIPANVDLEADLINKDIAEQVIDCVNKLRPRERLFLTLRFGLNGASPMKLQEIGDKFHVSRERCRQIEVSGLRNLKRIMLRKGDEEQWKRV